MWHIFAARYRARRQRCHFADARRRDIMSKTNILKIAAITLIVSGFSSLSFAKTYKCDVPRDLQGQILADSSTFSVVTDANGGVTLISALYTDGKGQFPHRIYSQMQPYSLLGTTTYYRSGDVLAKISYTVGAKSVELIVATNGGMYTASCK